MYETILKKAICPESLQDSDILKLFNPKNNEEFTLLIETAFNTKILNGKEVKLTSTIHITNQCQVTPKCKYCGFAAGTSPFGYNKPFYKSDDEILAAALCIFRSGIPRVSCSGAHGYKGEQAVHAASIVKENTSLELLVNVGSDLNQESLNKLKHYGTDTVCCNLETVNEKLFNNIKPGETLDQRINACRKISKSDIELSSGLLIGIGESHQDRINHLNFLKTFETLGEIPIMGFNPYKGTPMQDHPACSLKEQMITIAVTRILFPEIRITVPTPTIGPENIRYSLLSGADNIATVIPDNYPLRVLGVGSPVCGTLNQVINVIEEMGLDASMNSHRLNNVKMITVGHVIRHE